MTAFLKFNFFSVVNNWLKTVEPWLMSCCFNPVKGRVNFKPPQSSTTSNTASLSWSGAINKLAGTTNLNEPSVSGVVCTM